MRLIGFNFTKINLEKKSDNLKDLKITTDINLLDIKELKSELFNSSEDILAVKFEYTIKYEKDIALLSFTGNLLLSLDSRQVKEITKQWKDKKLPEDFKLKIFNIILKKASIRALQFEEDFNLPAHIPLPSFKAPEKK